MCTRWHTAIHIYFSISALEYILHTLKEKSVRIVHSSVTLPVKLLDREDENCRNDHAVYFSREHTALLIWQKIKRQEVDDLFRPGEMILFGTEVAEPRFELQDD